MTILSLINMKNIKLKSTLIYPEKYNSYEAISKSFLPISFSRITRIFRFEFLISAVGDVIVFSFSLGSGLLRIYEARFWFWFPFCYQFISNHQDVRENLRLRQLISHENPSPGFSFSLDIVTIASEVCVIFVLLATKSDCHLSLNFAYSLETSGFPELSSFITFVKLTFLGSN